MQQLLYRDLVPWYRLLDPWEDHVNEATCYREALERAALPRPETLLDLGAGAGCNAAHLKQRFHCTLTDISDDMLSLSRALNPECEHILGDMRALRLGRTFDVVLVHDAIMYMTSEHDLHAAVLTAFEHTRAGGAALFAPDFTRESFREGSEIHEGREGTRALRCLSWTWDPDPTDDTYTVEYAFLLRDQKNMTAVHDRHVEGLFARATWLRVLGDAGYQVEAIPRPLDEDGTKDEVFLCRKPASH